MMDKEEKSSQPDAPPPSTDSGEDDEDRFKSFADKGSEKEDSTRIPSIQEIQMMREAVREMQQKERGVDDYKEHLIKAFDKKIREALPTNTEKPVSTVKESRILKDADFEIESKATPVVSYENIKRQVFSKPDTDNAELMNAPHSTSSDSTLTIILILVGALCLAVVGLMAFYLL